MWDSIINPITIVKSYIYCMLGESYTKVRGSYDDSG